MTKIQLFHSTIPGNVPPEGLLTGEVAFNVADNFQFVGYGGDVNYDVYGNPLPDLPPPGMGWKTFVTGGGDQPGPPGPGVPPGGETGQVLTKLSDGDYVTGWADTFGPATPTEVGAVYGLTSPFLGGSYSVSLGYQANANIGTGVRNTTIGYQAGLNQNNVDDNVVVGHQAAWNIDGGQNVILGSEAFGNEPGGGAVGNVGVGYQTGYNLTSGDYNVFLGYQSGIGVRGGSGNVIIGNYPGDSSWSNNVVLADGSGDLKFLANAAGAWSTDGSDFGTEDFVLTSQGPNLPPVWKEIPLGFVSRIVAGENIYIDPADGVGVVTINATGGGGGGGITSIRANNGLLVSNGGTNPIITSGGLEVDFTKVVATSLYNAAGTLLVGGGSGTITSLPVGTAGQVLQVAQNGQVGWATVPSASPATPTTLGLVYGSTNTNNTYYGYNAGIAVSGTNNVLIGETAGSSVGAGFNNTIVGNWQGTTGMHDSVALATGAGRVSFYANPSGAWSTSGDSNFGQAGQVLTSQGVGAAPVWSTPTNAPITDVNDGPGISTSIAGTTLTINNEGVLSVTSSSPIVATTTNGNVALSGPTILTDLVNGAGISVTGQNNSRVITNTGVVSLTNGLNTTVSQVSPGVWKVDSSGGGGGTITSLTEGAGINIANRLGPNPTITNSGVISIQDGPNIIPDVNSGNVTLSLQGVVLGVTAANSGITVGGTPTNPTIANSGVISLQNGTGTTVQNVGNGVWQVNATGTAGVTKIIAGSNVSISPISGTGEVTISAAGGGGGGSITTIQGGDGIDVSSPTGPVTTITNKGVLSVTGGDNVTIKGTPTNPIINAVGTLNSLKNGKGINITGGTGPEATITNTGVVGLVAGANVTIQETGAGTGVFNISASGGGGGAVASVTGNGPGINVTPTTGAVVVQNTGVTSLTGTANNITVSGSTGAVTLNIGSNVLTNVTAGNSGITVAGTGNTRTISAAVVGLTAGDGIDLTNNSGNITVKNTGVLQLTAGSNVTITEVTPGSGNFQISSTGGGGGGTGTVTSITAGYGLSGGNITSSGTIAVNGDVVVTYDAYRAKGAGNILYSDSTGYDWTNNCSSGSPVAPMYLQGYQVGPATYVRWLPPEVGGFQDSPSITFHKALAPIVDRNEYYFEVSSTFQQDHCLNWSNNIPFIKAGQIPYGYPNVTAGQINNTHYLNPPPVDRDSIFFMSGVFNTVPILSDVYWEPKWYKLSDYVVTSVSVTAPILNTGTPKLPNIAFDVNTTALTKYVPTTAITLAGQILYGTGAGTVSALNIGNNGQVLSVGSNGLPQWIDPPTPGSQVNLSPGFGIELTPNPITGSGEIAVKANTFIETAVILNKGDMIYGSAAGVPARLAAGTAGQVLQMSNTGIPAWVTDVDAGTY